MNSKYRKLLSELEKLNKELDNYYDFDVDFSGDEYFIIDHTEYFYYDRPFFDETFSKVVKIVQKVFDKEYSIDCECPGRWIVFK